MVAIIKIGYSIRQHFAYNENKVKTRLAELIGAGNYPADTDKMTASMKLNRLLKLKELNENVKCHSVHISLNFSPNDAGLTKAKLLQIADDYMQKIGFEGQPYLVYQHYDAGHPHIHLVSVNVRKDGSRIKTHYIGSNRSFKACREIEKSFGLIPAAGQLKTKQSYKSTPVLATKLVYGRTETKQAISNVLDAVLNNYHYASLPELNAILRLYNIKADRCGKNSRTYRNRGLVYKILDEKGKPAGIPIKASSFYRRPTLSFLEKKFQSHTLKPASSKLRITNAIDMTLLGKSKKSLKGLIEALSKIGIQAVLQKKRDEATCSITYVDHQTKCVFTGSTLGKQYSIKAIQARCGSEKAFELKSRDYYTQTKATRLRTRPSRVM